MDIVFAALEELYNLVGKSMMAIRTSDLSKRPHNTPEERQYAIYVDRLSKRLGRCTQDSVRKNLFVDFHRMGLIERYNSNQEKVGPYATGVKKYVRITDLGIELINKKNTIFERKMRYTRAIDTLTNGLADKLLLISELDGYITETEFQFFLSFMGKRIDDRSYGLEELVDYVREFRRMSKYQKEAIIKVVSDYCEPRNFKGDKNNKRDYHNWKNETQQIFMLMGQTAYYEHRNGILNIRTGKDSVYLDKGKLARSRLEKENYFKNHNIKKEKGFELHHIVPLCWSRNIVEFSVLDSWKNLIYIDGYNHSIITQCGNEHVVLNFEENNIVLSNFTKGIIVCEHNKNVLYEVQLKQMMHEYNRELLKGAE